MICSSRLRTSLKGTVGFSTRNTNQYEIGLVGIIHGICCQFDEQNQVVYNLTKGNKRVDCFFQRKCVDNDTYNNNFKDLAEVVEIYGRAYKNDPGLIK